MPFIEKSLSPTSLYSLFQTYDILICRAFFPRHVKFSDAKNDAKYRCPISLSVLYQPIRIKGSGNVFSGPILREMTKTCKEDPLTGALLTGDWDNEVYDLDKEMSGQVVNVPLANGGNHILIITLCIAPICFTTCLHNRVFVTCHKVIG